MGKSKGVVAGRVSVSSCSRVSCMKGMGVGCRRSGTSPFFGVAVSRGVLPRLSVGVGNGALVVRPGGRGGCFGKGSCKLGLRPAMYRVGADSHRLGRVDTMKNKRFVTGDPLGASGLSVDVTKDDAVGFSGRLRTHGVGFDITKSKSVGTARLGMSGLSYDITNDNSVLLGKRTREKSLDMTNNKSVDTFKYILQGTRYDMTNNKSVRMRTSRRLSTDVTNNNRVRCRNSPRLDGDIVNKNSVGGG